MVDPVARIIYKVIVDLLKDWLPTFGITFECAFDIFQIKLAERENFGELAITQLTLREEHLSFLIHDVTFLTNQVSLRVNEVAREIREFAGLSFLFDNIKVFIQLESAHHICDLELSAEVVEKLGQASVFVQLFRVEQTSTPLVNDLTF